MRETFEVLVDAVAFVELVQCGDEQLALRRALEVLEELLETVAVKEERCGAIAGV